MFPLPSSLSFLSLLPYLPFVMVDTQVLSLPFHRGEGTHGNSPDGVVCKQLLHRLTLVSRKVESDILKSSLLRSKSGSLFGGERGKRGKGGKGERRGRRGREERKGGERGRREKESREEREGEQGGEGGRGREREEGEERREEGREGLNYISACKR